MAKATKALTTGMKILSGADLPTYTLEYLTPANGKNQGAYATIVVPYVELGRDSNCAIRFGDDTPTVSRKHAAISREGQETKIFNLSKNNPTLVNGRPVMDKYYLNNGDEIQLSLEGPRLRYNTSKQGTAKIGFTNRMNLVLQQAVKPYKAATAVIVLMLLMVSSVGSYFIYDLFEKTIVQDELLGEQREHLGEQSRLLVTQQELIDQMSIRMREQASEYLRRISDLQSANLSMGQIINELKGEIEEIRITAPSIQTETSEIYQVVKNDVYFIHSYQVFFTNSAGQRETREVPVTCSGFLLDDGKFVTARHCIQFWRYLKIGEASELEYFLSSQDASGIRIGVEFTATGPRDEFRFSSSDFIMGDNNDYLVNFYGYNFKVADLDASDWSYSQTSRTGGAIEYDTILSSRLFAGTRVYILGYSYGMGGATVSTDVSPLFSESSVAQNGLDRELGIINLTGRGFGPGNSGGPAFVLSDDKIKAIGIVSAGRGSEIGVLAPLSATGL